MTVEVPRLAAELGFETCVVEAGAEGPADGAGWRRLVASVAGGSPRADRPGP